MFQIQNLFAEPVRCTPKKCSDPRIDRHTVIASMKRNLFTALLKTAFFFVTIFWGFINNKTTTITISICFKKMNPLLLFNYH